jgi:hypothetical protein
MSDEKKSKSGALRYGVGPAVGLGAALTIAMAAGDKANEFSVTLPEYLETAIAGMNPQERESFFSNPQRVEAALGIDHNAPILVTLSHRGRSKELAFTAEDFKNAVAVDPASINVGEVLNAVDSYIFGLKEGESLPRSSITEAVRRQRETSTQRGW